MLITCVKHLFSRCSVGRSRTQGNSENLSFRLAIPRRSNFESIDSHHSDYSATVSDVIVLLYYKFTMLYYYIRSVASGYTKLVGFVNLYVLYIN